MAMNKRVLLVIGSLKTGGAERVTINTGAELEKKGYDVYYALQRNIIELPNTIPPHKIYVLRKSTSRSMIYKILAVFIGIFIVRLKVRPHVVIGFSRFSSFLACFSFSRRVIARFDANPFRLSKKQRVFANFVFRWPFVRKIVVPSSGMYKAISAVKPHKKELLTVIPNTIDTSTVVALSEKEPTHAFDFPYFCAMGRLSYDKNFELLIRAFHESKIREHYKLVLIGDGKLRSKLEELVRELGVERDVIFSGFMSNPYPVLKRADFLVNSSRNESFCNVILESLALSVPVIATDCDYGPADMIRNNENGFLIESDNQAQLVDVLNKIAEDRSVLNKFRDCAYESTRPFQLSEVIKKWIALLD